MGRPAHRSAPRRSQREAAISAFRAAPPLDERKLRQWELQQEAEDEHAPATEIEMHAALKLIRSRLVRRGLAEYARAHATQHAATPSFSQRTLTHKQISQSKWTGRAHVDVPLTHSEEPVYVIA